MHFGGISAVAKDASSHQASRSAILLSKQRNLQTIGLHSTNEATNALTSTNLAHAKKVTHETVQREAILRLHKVNEQMLLHMQEVEEELKEYVEIFQLKEGARDSSPFA